MSQYKAHGLFERVDNLEMRYCIWLNGSSRRVFIRLFFRTISRLGDGIFWYILAAFLPYLHGAAGTVQALHVLLTGLVGVAIYKVLKQRLVRERPYINIAHVQQGAPALDRYSFPSGHTMHAFSFSILLSYYLPDIASLVWGFTALVALSRVVLGLHYPSDVFVGALLGSLLALSSLVLFAV